MSADGSDFEDDQQDQDEIVLDNEGPEEDFQEEENGAHPAEPGAMRIQQKVGDRTCATYTFDGEDHTLGNLLRFALIKNPDVEFCGYSITHPSEHTINMRLQTTGRGTNDVIAEGLESIVFMTDVTERKFREALEAATADSKNKKKKTRKAEA